MPCTPWRRTSSAIRNASSRVVFDEATWASRSLGMTMSASTWPRRALMPSSAVSLRIRPSNENGRVTTPIVSAPASFASSATIAADPVPVPPPMPAVMNTMSDSCTTADSSVRDSSAASRPRVQSPPAPRPRVILLPIWTLTSAWQRSSACLSVLTAMNWTLSAFEIMRLTALPPPPPQPTTLIRARPSCNSLSFTTSSWCKFAFAMASSSWFRVCSLEKISKPPHCLLIGRTERHLLPGVVVVARACLHAPLDQPDRNRERRALRTVGQTGDAGWRAEPDRGVEDELGGVGRAHETRTAAGDDDARGQEPVEAALADLLAGHLEDLLHARADDLGEEAPREGVDAIAADLAHLDLLAVVDDLRQRVAVVELQALCLIEGRPQSDRDVARHVVAADRHHSEVSRGALVVNDDRGRTGADVDEAHAQVQLLGRQDPFAAGEPRADDIFDVEARSMHALDDVLDRGLRAGDDVGLDLEPVSGHADRVADAVLSIDRVCAGDDVDDLAVGGDADRARRFDHTLHVVLTDLAVAPGDGHDAHRVLRPQVDSTERDDNRLDSLPGHALGGHGRGLDGRDGFVEVDDDSLAQPVGWAFTHADDAHGPAGLVRLGYDNRDPARAQVKTDRSLPPRQCVLERLLERCRDVRAGCRRL